MKNRPVILYAEDDPDDREILRDALKEKGIDHEIVEVANGREALLFLRSTKGLNNPPCLILLDLNMPVLNGRETLAIIKSDNDIHTMPVIIFTTSSSPLDDEFCHKFSVEMITKPSSPQELDSVAVHLLTYLS
jgi:CheY-like chemotaxis protein